MLGSFLLVGLWSVLPQENLILELDRLAQARDSKTLTTYLSAPQDPNPFRCLSGGAYGVGKFGWHARALSGPRGGGSFVVFTTPITGEDVGELLFAIKNGKLDYIPEDDLLGVKIKHHNFDISFNTAQKTARLRDRVTLDSATSGLKFLRFGPPYQLDSINGAKDFKQTGGMVALELPAGRQTLDIRYHAVVNLPQYAASISKDEFTLTNDYWYPMVGRWPATYEMTVHTPLGWVTAGQGTLVSHAHESNGELWTYRMDLPVCYYSVTAAPFKTVSQQIHGRTYSVWSTFVPRARQELQGPVYSGIIEFYNSAFGPWPFNGYGAVISKSYGGGAMEAYSYATYGDNDIPGEDSHEPSHTYWGGVIPNTYLHSFWNESFANFSMGLYSRNATIGSVEDRRLAFVTHPSVSEVFKEVAVSKGSVFAGAAASVMGYGKGAEVLAMLEDEIGTPLMLKSMQYWVKNHAPATPGEWDEFESSVNTVTGKDYGWFFNQWLDRTGYAVFKIRDVQFDGAAVTAKLSYDDEPYRLTMEVLLGYADGTTDLRRIVIPAKPSSDITISTSRKPKWVSFDPYRRLMRPIDPNETPFNIRLARGTFTDASPTSASQFPGHIISADSVDNPGIAELAKKAGFEVSGLKLSYRGTTINLKTEQALAVVNLDGGQRCLLILGHAALEPQVGDAVVALVDHYGRFLRGETRPKTAGNLVFRID